jgi:lipopolysaccharide/colanic/teichoic acid biosynthesis glycosyltransferase
MVLSSNSAVSRWTASKGKRCFDFVIALLLTIVLLPLMGIVAVTVLVLSGRPILFRQLRCARGRKTFSLLKFRSMRNDNAGPGLTQSGDSRVTPIGRWLRQWKMDELPQLFNVLGGQLSLVGPRPELPEYIAALGDQAEALLQSKPGITGWATLHYRDEEKVLAQSSGETAHDYYVRVLLPAKCALDLEYAARATMFSDIQLLLGTCFAILPGASSERRRSAKTATSTR